MYLFFQYWYNIYRALLGKVTVLINYEGREISEPSRYQIRFLAGEYPCRLSLRPWMDNCGAMQLENGANRLVDEIANANLESLALIQKNLTAAIQEYVGEDRYLLYGTIAQVEDSVESITVSEYPFISFSSAHRASSGSWQRAVVINLKMFKEYIEDTVTVQTDLAKIKKSTKKAK